MKTTMMMMAMMAQTTHTQLMMDQILITQTVSDRVWFLCLLTSMLWFRDSVVCSLVHLVQTNKNKKH